MSQFKSNNTDNDEGDGNKPDDVIRVAKEKNPCHDGSCSTDPCPNSICSTYRNRFHRLRDGKEAQHNKNDSDDARYEFGKSLTILQRDGEANFKETGE